MKIIIIILIVLVLFIMSFLPLFPKKVKSGTIKINAWDKIMTLLGMKYID